MMSSTDRIEKKRLLRAPRDRVWRALTDPAEFGSWFGMRLDAPRFEPRAHVRGRITIPEYAHVVVDMWITKLEPQRLFSYRWHPYAVDPAVDYSKEEPTLVEFVLEDAPGGTLLLASESGFDRIPIARRAEAYRMNTGGWEAQLENIAKHVEG
ncbi:SRPBCC family protein [Sandaracinus amylolyticus]|uniref:SRPBCC family protein n=1 Tax=Sandaracinus amylolyticus TaxID=927083 RepID=UPI003AF391BD